MFGDKPKIIGLLGLAVFITGCSAFTDTTDCEVMCRSTTISKPLNDCMEIDAEYRCVFACEEDSDCDSDWYVGCSSKADDGSLFCTDKTPEEEDAGTT